MNKIISYTMKIIQALILFLLPTWFSRRMFFFTSSVRIEKGVKIGFSIILANNIYLAKGAVIGHFNFISLNRLILKEGSRILKYNFFKGPIQVTIGEFSRVKHWNKVIRAKYPVTSGISVFQIGKQCALGMNTTFDLTDSIYIKNNCVIAGSGTQLWTHGYYHLKNESRARVEGVIKIGSNNYIGSSCIFLPGTETCKNVTLGTNCVVSKSIYNEGAYVNQGLKFIGEIDETKLNKFEKVEFEGMIEPVYKKIL